MDVTKILHANGGAKEITYANNSSAQKQMLSLAKPFVEEALHDYFGGTHIPDKMVIADLGCSSGPNALTPASEIIDAVHAQCQKLGHRSPEFMMFLNDLPGNDFNDIFTSLQPDFFSKLREDEQCRVAGVPGSFYGRLFLRRSLHFVHSSSSLHWLSQVPPGLDAKNGPMQNKGKIYITKTSTKAVIDAYKQQFKKDFNLFLKSRAEEVIPGGRMVLTFLGWMSNDPTTKEGFNHHIEMIAQSLMNMVSKFISWNEAKAEEEMREKGNKMDMARVLHVNGGTKEITYAKNSSAQKQILFIAKPLLEEALHEYFGGTQFQNKMVIAELGCSSGPNALTPALEIIDVVHAQCQKRGRRLPEFMVFLNDLPGNDFNDIFTSLQQDFFSKLREEEQCRVAGVPGSFYGRLFLSRSLHFVHSSSSLHWLSQVPPGLDAKSGAMQNKGKVYISKTSTKAVMDAYKQQFKTDFISFLKSRAEELISGGRMVLTFFGRMSKDPTAEEGFNHHTEMIAQSLMNMVSEGIIPEEKVDCFNLPCYAACTEEVKEIVEDEGSFVMDHLESMEVDLVDFEGDNVLLSRGERVARMLRVMLESILGYHFGMELMDDLFARHVDVVNGYLPTAYCKFTTFVLSLTRQ